MGLSLVFFYIFNNVRSFSDYLRAFLILDMPASWCPTFLTLYGAASLIANFLSSAGLKRTFAALSSFAGLMLLPVGIYAAYSFTRGQTFGFSFMYLYAQAIHISEVLTGILTVYLLVREEETGTSKVAG